MTSRSSVDGKLQEVKHLLSPRVLQVRGVSGVGTRGGRLTVYLEYDSDEVKEEIIKVVAEVAPGYSCDFVVTGRFVKQG